VKEKRKTLKQLDRYLDKGRVRILHHIVCLMAGSGLDRSTIGVCVDARDDKERDNIAWPKWCNDVAKKD
jgi:hypothetical protein